MKKRGLSPLVTLQPVGYRKAYADAALIVIIVNHALAVAGKALDIALEILVAPQGKAPGQLNSPFAETGLKVVARHD